MSSANCPNASAMISISIEERMWHGTRGDETQRIARARNQSVRIHRQLSQMRGLFHRLEHRVAGPLPELSAPMQSLAQKIDAFDHAVADIHDRARLLQEEMAGRMAELTNRRLLTPVASDRGDPAADIGHRLLRHEHQRPAIPGHRRWHLVCLCHRGSGRCLHLLGAAAIARVLIASVLQAEYYLPQLLESRGRRRPAGASARRSVASPTADRQ